MRDRFVAGLTGFPKVRLHSLTLVATTESERKGTSISGSCERPRVELCNYERHPLAGARSYQIAGAGARKPSAFSSR
jgi:hypothetical protein